MIEEAYITKCGHSFWYVFIPWVGLYERVERW